MKSVAIVAMGTTNQEWFRRCYSGDNTKLNARIVKEQMLVALRGHQLSPQDVALVNQLCGTLGKRYTDRILGQPFDQVWAINHMGKLIKEVDLIFAMDDLKKEEDRYNTMLTGDVPIMTSTVYPEYNCIEYPLNDVLHDLGQLYFKNTIAYAMAYAIHKKFERIGLFGCDFYYEDNSARSEQARANCEFWMGVAHARGIKLEVSKGSTTMDMNKVNLLYGYAKQPVVKYDDKHNLEFNGKQWLLVKKDDGDAPPGSGPKAPELAESAVQPRPSPGPDKPGAVPVADGILPGREGQPGEVPDSGEPGRKDTNGGLGNLDTPDRSVPGVVGGEEVQLPSKSMDGG